MLRARIMAFCLSVVAGACHRRDGGSSGRDGNAASGSRTLFPAVLFVPGCLGFDSGNGPKTFADMAGSWRTKGYVVVYVDYLKARGQKECDGDSPSDVAKDILAVTSYLQAQSFIKSSEITAIGWSLDGIAASSSLLLPDEMILARTTTVGRKLARCVDFTIES